MPYLLDTNILSELRKGQACNDSVKRWAQSTASDRHCISVLSLGEIRKGIEVLRRRSPQQCPAFESWLLKLRDANMYSQFLPTDTFNRVFSAKSSMCIIDVPRAFAIVC